MKREDLLSKKFEEVTILREEERKLEEEVNRKVHEYQKKVSAELGLTQLSKKSWAVWKAAKEETKANFRRFAEEAFRGEHGPGEAVVISDSSHNRRVSRVIFCGVGPRKDGGVIHQYDLVLSTSTENFYEQHQLWAEVGTGLGKEELTKLFHALRKEGWGSSLFGLFPEGFEFPLTPGDKFDWGSCSHHSGDISAWGEVLPSGRMGIFTEYSGETPFGGGGISNALFEGIAPSLRWEASLTAKGSELRNSGELLPPKAEEIEYVKSKGYEYD